MSLKPFLLDLLFPPKCTFCGGLLERSGLLMCPDCQRSLPWLEGPAAEKRVEFASRCVSPLSYQDSVRRSIQRFKFAGRRWYAKTYGLLISQCVQDHLAGEYDLITWVPVSAKRRRERGYDQSRLLAEELGKYIGLVAVELLKKPKDNPAQSTLKDAAQRRANVLGAYTAPWPERMAGKRVLLVDDVVTTGETLSECARTLRMAGAEDVVCVTLARAK